MSILEHLSKRELQKEVDNLQLPYEPRIMKTITKGKSGATVHLVRIMKNDKRVSAILKIEQIAHNENEAELHQQARKLAKTNDKDCFIPTILYATQVDSESIILYEFVGKNDGYTLNDVLSEERIEHIPFFAEAIATYLSIWNLEHDEDWIHPQRLLKQTLGRRDDHKLLDAFNTIHINTNHTYIMHDGVRLPNPAKYIIEEHLWGDDEVDCLFSMSHGDFHGDNIILYKNGFSIIDFAELQLDTNIFYDEKYLELHLLMDYFSFEDTSEQLYWNKLCQALSTGLTNTSMTIPYGRGHLILDHVLTSIHKQRCTLLAKELDEEVLLRLEPSYYIAGVCAGLNFMRKYPDSKKKFAAFLYAAHHLKSVLEHETLQLEELNDNAFPIEWPSIPINTTTAPTQHTDNKKQQAVREIIESENIDIAAQPIVHLLTGEVKGVELLCRDPRNILSPIELFSEARKMGVLDKMTLITCDKIIEAGQLLEELSLKAVFVNLESDLSMPCLEAAMDKLNKLKQPVVIEFTEHEEKTRFKKHWRSIIHGEGFKLALDDIGEGKSDLTDINIVQPDMIKVVMVNIDAHAPSKLRDRGSIHHHFDNNQFIIEQIETWSDLKKSREFGFLYGQGYYFHRPVMMEDIQMILGEWRNGYKSLLAEGSEKKQ